MKIGDNIKTIRKQKGIKQKELAAILNMPVSTLANYENNKREPSIEVLYNICDALKIDSLKLLNNDDSTFMLLHGKSDSEKLLHSDDNLVSSIGSALVLLQGHIHDCIEFYYSDNTAYKKSILELIDSLSRFIDPSCQFEFSDADIVAATSDISQFIKYKTNLLELTKGKKTINNIDNKEGE